MSEESKLTPEEIAALKEKLALLQGYRSCVGIVEKFNKDLVTARIEGRWDDVVEHFYHRHYTEAFLRHTGALNHYLGKDVEQDDPQLYS